MIHIHRYTTVFVFKTKMDIMLERTPLFYDKDVICEIQECEKCGKRRGFVHRPDRTTKMSDYVLFQAVGIMNKMDE